MPFALYRIHRPGALLFVLVFILLSCHSGKASLHLFSGGLSRTKTHFSLLFYSRELCYIQGGEEVENKSARSLKLVQIDSLAGVCFKMSRVISQPDVWQSPDLLMAEKEPPQRSLTINIVHILKRFKCPIYIIVPQGSNIRPVRTLKVLKVFSSFVINPGCYSL